MKTSEEKRISRSVKKIMKQDRKKNKQKRTVNKKKLVIRLVAILSAAAILVTGLIHIIKRHNKNKAEDNNTSISNVVTVDDIGTELEFETEKNSEYGEVTGAVVKEEIVEVKTKNNETKYYVNEKAKEKAEEKGFTDSAKPQTKVEIDDAKGALEVKTDKTTGEEIVVIKDDLTKEQKEEVKEVVTEEKGTLNANGTYTIDGVTFETKADYEQWIIQGYSGYNLVDGIMLSDERIAELMNEYSK